MAAQPALPCNQGGPHAGGTYITGPDGKTYEMVQGDTGKVEPHQESWTAVDEYDDDLEPCPPECEDEDCSSIEIGGVVTSIEYIPTFTEESYVPCHVPPAPIPKFVPLTDPPTPHPTVSPTVAPTVAPTVSPTTLPPTVSPTVAPTVAPTVSPTTLPPTKNPTRAPTVSPTHTIPPTMHPTTLPPTMHPTTLPPTMNPTTLPPTMHPTTHAPTLHPTVQPTVSPTTLPPTLHPTESPTLVFGIEGEGALADEDENYISGNGDADNGFEMGSAAKGGSAAKFAASAEYDVHGNIVQTGKTHQEYEAAVEYEDSIFGSAYWNNNPNFPEIIPGAAIVNGVPCNPQVQLPPAPSPPCNIPPPPFSPQTAGTAPCQQPCQPQPPCTTAIAPAVPGAGRKLEEQTDLAFQVSSNTAFLTLMIWLLA